MENASKALIIAGAILLSIALIGIGMYVYQMAAGTMGNVNMSEQEITAYNATFTKYQGKQLGSTCRGLCDAIISHNATYSDDDSKQITLVSPQNSGTKDVNAISTAKSKITAGTYYTVSFEYTAGLITKITIQ